jgi:hypothetical protein
VKSGFGGRLPGSEDASALTRDEAFRHLVRHEGIGTRYRELLEANNDGKLLLPARNIDDPGYLTGSPAQGPYVAYYLAGY